MTISIIVAISLNRAIGNKNKLLYWLPNDLRRFKTLTTGNTIIMGRKTFESLPKGALPNRRNVVISTQKGLQYPGAEVYPSLEDALLSCDNDSAVFLIGGESVYKQAMELANRLYLTEIQDYPAEADAFFPEIDKQVWKETKREVHTIDEEHRYPYTFIDYCRKS